MPSRTALLEVLVGGGEDPDVHLDRLRAADALQLALLQGAEDLGLGRERHVADFVEQQRAAVGLLELSELAAEGAGERALLVAEELRLEQRLGNRRAIELHERPAAASRVLVNGLGDQLLAGAALTENQHRRIGGADAIDEPHDVFHRAARANEPAAPAIGRPAPG